MALHQLVQLQAHQARHGGCGGGDGWDDPPGDALALWRKGTPGQRDARTDTLQAGGFSSDPPGCSLQQRICRYFKEHV